MRNQMTKLRQVIVFALIFCFGSMAATAPVQAAMIDSASLLQAQPAAERQAAEAKLLQALSRPELQRQLAQLGVDPATARDRVAALTDEELASMGQRVDQLPAGGDFIGTVAFIFVLLLVTDLLGLTKVFSFTRAKR